MNIIFLDIDGVLNSHDWFERRGKLSPDATRDEFYAHDFDPEAVARFRMLAMDTNAEIVLSSTWRLHEDNRDAVRKYVMEFRDITPECDSRIRGAEIYMWIQKNIPYDERKNLKYAIIDDDSDMLLWQKDDFFQTSFKTGLTDEVCDKIRKHFSC